MKKEKIEVVKDLPKFIPIEKHKELQIWHLQKQIELLEFMKRMHYWEEAAERNINIEIQWLHKNIEWLNRKE